jgi:hypothetical protein
MADVYSNCGCGTKCGDAPDVRVVAGNDLTVEALVSIYDEDKGYYASFDLTGASDVKMRIVGAYSKVEGENVTVSGSKAKALFKAGRYGAGNYGVEITFTRGQESFRVFERGLFSVVRDSGEASLGTSAEGGSGEGMNISVDVRSRTLRVGQVSGITDYNLLENRPSIGGVTLEGDKRPSDLGMYSKEEADGKFETKSHAADTFQTKESAAEADKRVQEMLDGKVDKEPGKGLSANDLTDERAGKVDMLAKDGRANEHLNGAGTYSRPVRQGYGVSVADDNTVSVDPQVIARQSDVANVAASLESVNQIRQKVSGLETRAGGLPLMELGNISSAGTDKPNNSYARTKGYIQGPFSIKLASGLIFGYIVKFRKDGNTYTKINHESAGTSLYIATNDEYYYRFAVNYNGQSVVNPQDVIELATLKDVLDDANIKSMTDNTKEIVGVSAPFSSSAVSGGTLSVGRMPLTSLTGTITSTISCKYTEMIPIVRGKEYHVKTDIESLYDAGVAYYKTNTISPENFCGLDRSFVGDGSTNQKVTKTGKLEIPANANYFVIFTRDASVMEITELSPVASAKNSALDGKVDKIAGKGLSTNDFSNDDKIKLDSLQPGGVPEEVVRQAVNDYLEENSGGFITQPNGLNVIASMTYKLQPSVLPSETSVIGAGWAGSIDSGFTHTAGNTDALEFTMASVPNLAKLLITFDVQGLSERNDVYISAGESALIKSYNGGSQVVAGLIYAGGNLKVTPTSNFAGTITNLKCRVLDDNGTESYTTSVNNVYCQRNSLVAGYWNAFIGGKTTTASRMQDGTRNIAIGEEALNRMVVGNRNVAIGTYSMPTVTEGENNIAIGSDSIYPVKKAINSISIGKGTMSGKSVENCVALGYGAMGLWDFEFIRDGCTAIGALSAVGVIKGNTHVGYRAGVNTKGAYNTSIGYNSLGIGTRSSIDIVGENLTCVGHDASVANNDTAKAANNSTALGYGATITKSNQVVIGNKQIEEVILGGKRLLFNNDNTVSWETIS